MSENFVTLWWTIKEVLQVGNWCVHGLNALYDDQLCRASQCIWMGNEQQGCDQVDVCRLMEVKNAPDKFLASWLSPIISEDGGSGIDFFLLCFFLERYMNGVFFIYCFNVFLFCLLLSQLVYDPHLSLVYA